MVANAFQYSSIQSLYYKQFRDNFDTVVKRIPASGTVSPFTETRERQSTDSVEAYNTFVAYIKGNFASIIVEENKEKVTKRAKSAREKLVRLLTRIGYRIDLEGLDQFDLIDLNRLSIINDPVEAGTSTN